MQEPDLKSQYEAMSSEQLEKLLSEASLTNDARSLCKEEINKKLGYDKYELDVLDKEVDEKPGQYWFMVALKKYAVFQGRARRKEFWYFVLFTIVFSVLAAFLDLALNSYTAYGGVIGLLFEVAIIIPSLSVTVRRLHDVGKSGWWLLILLIPLVGLIILIIDLTTDSKESTNKYGPNPKLKRTATE